MPLLRRAVSNDLTLWWRIDAPRSRVWRCITSADALGLWLGRVVEGSVDVQAEFVVDHGDGCLCRSSVLSCMELDRLAISWDFPGEPASEVTFELGESAGATEVRLTHSGLGDLVPSYRDGWCVHLTYLEAAALGTPLPLSMFWQLHSTIARLAER